MRVRERVREERSASNIEGGASGVQYVDFFSSISVLWERDTPLPYVYCAVSILFFRCVCVCVSEGGGEGDEAGAGRGEGGRGMCMHAVSTKEYERGKCGRMKMKVGGGS